MNWVSEIFSGAVDKVIDSVGNALDKLFTSDEERLKAQVLLDKVKSEMNLELGRQALEYDKQITERWKSDNEHAITRLVRPSIVIWTYFLFTIVMLLDGNLGNFHINPAYIPMLETIVVTVTVAYFGSRGVEKVSKFIEKGD
ncbi:hypothetical protein [Nitrosophilus kaiyonis]|uniref:hypothetical protein n=1 Tax=Nitrosophilus kaiyonis TaxID=2930200 RepID=UPI00248FA45A|nr:hypothetical protein [Nitrosophilus kaiyonis]